MGLITDLHPVNYQEEKQRFLADPTFDPQFRYVRRFSTDELTSYGFPTDEYLTLAQKILDAIVAHVSPAEIQQLRGEVLNPDTVTTAFENFLTAHGLEGQFQIVWSTEFVSRAAVRTDRTIKLRLPNSIREHDLEGLIYHELGTHVLRQVNYQQQPWYRRKKRHGFSPYLKTEEGLGAIHAALPKTGFSDQTLKNVVNYLAIQKAQEGSFLDVWQFVSQYFTDPDTAFTISFKQKRGLPDTSRPGGFTKDLVYFEGFADTSRFLVRHDFPIEQLYFGKLAWQDIDRAVQLNPDFKPLLPSFYTQDPAYYRQRVTDIAKLNFLI